MDRAKLLERLMATFVGELAEHVRTLNGELLALEKDPGGAGRAERFKTLLRAAHSLKGAARSVNVGLIEEASHRLEDVLLAVRDGRVAPDPGVFALLYAAADAFEEAGMRLREQHDLVGSPLDLLVPGLESAAAGTTPAADEPAPTPTPTPTPPPTPATPPPAPRDADQLPPAALVAATAVGPAPAAAPPAARPAPERPRESGAFVRVAAEKLDALLTRSGEMLVARRRVEKRGDQLAALRDSVSRWGEEWRQATHVRAGSARGGERLVLVEKELERFALAFDGDRRQLDRAAGLLDEEVRRARMQPFAEGCQWLERAARDVAAAEGKLVSLVIDGGDVEIDRSVLEGLKDPLSHLVCNAVDHGVERPEARRAAGKPEAARVRVSAALRGAQVEVVVEDDGAGVDLDAVRARLVERGLPEPADDRDLVEAILLPGFSTAARVTSLSGRGVGLDVVKTRVEACHGTVSVATQRGRGTRFTLSVPLTLTALRAVMLKAGGQTFALAVANVQRLVRVDPSEVRMVAGRGVLVVPGGTPIPVAPLAELLGLPEAPAARAEAGKRPGLVVVSGDRRAAVLVDELLGEQEVTVKGLGDRLRRVRCVSGATILPEGPVALVLNASSLARAAPGRSAARPADAPAARKRVLVVDDSVTIRALEKDNLESAGYEVITAVDGEDGWRVLQQQGADLLISDVEMPRMDGLTLTQTVRSSPRFSGLPVILFTTRASDADRARGIEVGADAYMVKSSPDQKDLLETIAQLL